MDANPTKTYRIKIDTWFATLILLLFAVFVVLVPESVEAIETANYTSATNRRFDNDASFIGAAFDWSGVGRGTSASGGLGRWATLIGDNYFLTATHFKADGTVSFIAGNDPADPVLTYPVAGGFQVTGTDFWLGYTTTSIDSALARYPVTTTDADSLSDAGLYDVDLFVSGDRVAGVSGGLTDHVVGTNRSESWHETGATLVEAPLPSPLANANLNFSAAATFDQIISFENVSGDTPNTLTTYESQLQVGDSGAPLFTGSGGTLTLQGLNYGVVGLPPGLPANFDGVSGAESRAASFYSYVGSYQAELQAAIAQVPAAVPEPDGLGMLVLSGALMLVLGRRCIRKDALAR